MVRKRGKSGQRRGFTFLVFAVAVVAIMAIAYVIHKERLRDITRPVPIQKEKPVSRPSPPVTRQEPGPSQPQGQEPAVPVDKRPEIDKIVPVKKKVAIIIDDIGNDLKSMQVLSNIDAPIAFAILPFCPHTRESAESLHKKNKEILLHLPMEPWKYPAIKPGKGVLLVKMKDEDVEKQLEKDIASVPYITGINNHMGSRFMEDEAKLSVVFKKIRENGLFFIDSRTTPQSKGSKIATQMGIPFMERKIFIDNNPDSREISKVLMSLLENENRGDPSPIVIIGHPRPGTVEALRKTIPLLKEKGIEFVSLAGTIQKNKVRKISRK